MSVFLLLLRPLLLIFQTGYELKTQLVLRIKATPKGWLLLLPPYRLTLITKPQTENEKSNVWQRNGQNAKLGVQDDGIDVQCC